MSKGDLWANERKCAILHFICNDEDSARQKCLQRRNPLAERFWAAYLSDSLPSIKAEGGTCVRGRVVGFDGRSRYRAK